MLDFEVLKKLKKKLSVNMLLLVYYWPNYVCNFVLMMVVVLECNLLF